MNDRQFITEKQRKADEADEVKADIIAWILIIANLFAFIYT